MAHPDDIAFIEHFFQLNPAHRMSAKEGLALPNLSDVHNALAASISSNKGDSVATSFYLNNLYLTSPGTPFDTANLSSKLHLLSKNCYSFTLPQRLSKLEYGGGISFESFEFFEYLFELKTNNSSKLS